MQTQKYQLCSTFVLGARDYFALQPGAQKGAGMLDVADRWLATTWEELLDVAAAANPATTTPNAKILIASFIVGNLFCGVKGAKVTPRLTLLG
jgi:hypothetical protein